MQAKKILSLLLVLALALAIFALPAAAETHDHDGCAACAEEIQPRIKTCICPQCGAIAYYAYKVQMDNGKWDYIYKCSESYHEFSGPNPF